MGLGSEEGKVKSSWDVCKSKERKKKDGTKAGCWVKLRLVGGCISSRSKVDSSVSGTSTHFESKSINDTSTDQPAVPVVSSSTTSNTESNSSLSKLEEELKVASRLRKFTFNDLKLATRNFRPESLLGEGGFGCVFKGWIEENGTAPVKPGTGLTVAVKTLNHDGLQGHKEWLAEVNYLGDLVHPNLVKLIGYCIEDDQRLLVYEFMPRGSLENHLFRRSLPLPWSIRMKIALGAAKGLAFLHEEAERPVIYRDFKTSNILLDADYNAKLSDFGLAKDAPEGDKTHVSTRVMGTYGYAAPEYVMTGHLTSRSDVYSFGVVLLEMITGRRSMDKNRPNGEHNLVEWARPYLGERRRFYRLIDPRLQGHFSIKGATTTASSSSGSGKTMLGERKSKRATLMQIQNDTISAAKAAMKTTAGINIMPQKQKKNPVSYSQLARSIHELAATSDQKSSQKQLVHHVFPKLAVYNSVDPSLAPSLLMLDQQCEDRTILRYVYYYLARILSDTGSQGLNPGGGIPTPNWDALADIDAVGGVTRADVVPRIVDQLSKEASDANVEFHARRLQALKALTYAPESNTGILSRLYEIVFGILDKVGDNPQKRKKGVFGTKGGDKESIVRSNLQYAALSALRRLPLDPGNPAFLHRAVQGVSFADPVAVRHALEILSELATKDPYGVAMALGKLVVPGGALQDVLHLHDVLARVSLARLCHTISRARALDERPDIKSQFNSVLYQLLLDPSERVCFEAIFCVLGKHDNTERTEERAAGWYRLTREILKLPEAPSLSSKGSIADSNDMSKASKDKSHKTRRPQPLIKLVMRRLESSFRNFSRPVLHAAARVVQEMGKSRAAAYAVGLQDIDEGVNVNSFSESADPVDSDFNENPYADGARKVSAVSSATGSKDTIAGLLASLMEVVRTTVACECVYVRAMVIKALIWMQLPHESFEELESIIASELSDPSWPATLLNDVLLTLHARFKATPDMAVTLLEIARIFATKVPGKIDADVLQLLWKTCLVGAGPDGKHTALEAVTIVLDLPPPQPGSMLGLTSVDRVSASDPKSALALQRLVQAAVWFLGENANYAASEYAWESATPPGTALMMLDADKMVAAASSRNPTLAGALTRLQRCAFSGSWEVRIVAAQALTTMAIRSGEPFRLQIYEFLNALAQGGVQSQLSEMHLSNGEDQGASGTGLGVLISPMVKVLDEMYRAQDELIRDIRNHDNTNKEWTDEELKKLYETHERLLDIVSLFCYVPRAKYLPLGPISAKLIDIYRTKHNISASTGLSDPAVATGISDLMYESKPAPVESDALDDDLVNAWAANLGDDGLLGNSAPAMSRVNEFLAGMGTEAPDVEEENIISRPSVSYDDMWAKTLLESSELEEDVRSSGSSSPDSIGSVETSISSHFGGMNYPSLFSSRPTSYGASQISERSGGNRYSGPSSFYEGAGSPIREEPPPYTSPDRSFENPLAGHGSRSFESQESGRASSANPQYGSALYDFSAGGDDELSLTAGEELEIEYEVDGWFYVKKKRPGRDGKMAGLVPVLYVNQS